MENLHLYIYAALILAGSIGILWVLRYLSSLEELRRKRLFRAKNSEVLTPEELDTSKIKKQRLKSLENRFTIIRRSLYTLFFVVVLIIAAIPLSNHISPTVVSVVIACLSVVTGIAAKPVIENFICGLVLCFGKLARIGDIVLIDNEYGTLEDVTLTHCVVRRWDWLRYVVPNSVMMTKEFVNYSLRDNYRWVHVEFFFDIKADMGLIEEIVKRSPESSPYFSGTEEAKFWVVEISPETVKGMVVAWATSAADGWMLSIDIRKNLLVEFQKHGIETHLRKVELRNSNVQYSNVHQNPGVEV